MSHRITIGLLLLFLSSNISAIQKTAKAQVSTQVTPPTTAKKICPEQLGVAVNEITNRSQFRRVNWGISVQTLSSSQTIYHRDAQKYFTPASVAKVLTTAAALQHLGANFRIRTSVFRSGDGVLRVVGRGDPSLSDTQLQTLAKRLSQQRIRQVKQLIVDDSYIQADIVHPTWQWEDLQSDYGAPINSLIVNQNVFSLKLLPQALGKTLQIIWTDPNEAKQWQIINQSVTVGQNKPALINVTRDLKKPLLRIQGQLGVGSEPLTVALPVVDPAEYFLRRFRSALTTEKIIVAETSVGSGGIYQAELAAVQSPALSELLAETNLNSNNLYAEALLRALAAKQPRKKNQNTADVGLEVLQATLTKLGVEPTTYVLVDGSGLSRRNLVSPEALVQTLRGMTKSPAASVYLASLPVAGKSGGLKNRFRDTLAEGIVHAKTGTMTGVVSLAGYVNAPKYEPLVFSIIVNQSDQPAKIVREAVDEIVVLLAQLQRC